MLATTQCLTSAAFNQTLLAWYDVHGRHDLPWRQQITPYRVWVSEIMLQQTQVNAVIPYYQRFMAAFPDIATLANAPIDRVLQHWAGLGYYARARNLHKTAQIICEQYQQQFPHTVDDLIQFPGIGRSTAGAIAAIAYQQPTAILDGNVRRVLARLHAISGWPGQPQIQQQLWAIAEQYTPVERADDYTQAIMDLGAMVCTRGAPKCAQCPVEQFCLAAQQKNPTLYPTPKPRTIVPTKCIHVLLIVNAKQQLLLEKRPTYGIWGGLWSLPEQDVPPEKFLAKYMFAIQDIQALPVLKHMFTHFRCDITPWRAVVDQPEIVCVAESDQFGWYQSQDIAHLGLPAPIKQLVKKYFGE